MKKLTANFYPANEPKNGYIGKANITIADAIRLNGISVFQNAKDDTINLSFPEFGDGVSYVVPKSKEAYAAMAAVVAKAIENEKHFGYSTGEYGPFMNVTGHAVSEPYADARFSIDVEDICTLYGISTRVVDYKKDGKDHSFVSVDFPTIGTYENTQGETQYRRAFDGRVSKWTDREGKEQSRDYGQLLNGLVLAERHHILDRKPSLETQMNGADQRKGNVSAAHDAPAMEATR